ncbi:hypothetical protein PPTG_12062 [Phytophthora nicotianae INRA-310]|uniref:Uncharacterized protein n=1 Tax=Phytophthora nicotianae (strain INRA-310) TaxID=761204 RepID=W2Q5S2_PHYN3|nr:hypothetical protein PPTG_12062 [Phytophthora nicotianae INRA-310]ETN08221.1 hypothetical protein PPTG_12062 [Phytophthora nicotianae INRA-310]
MEGIVLVEMSSGALHYTKSFSDEFDARHPKTERLNFGALIFALQNFAGSSIRSMESSDGLDAAKGLERSNVAEIVMYTTPLENMVLATTPSSKLLVVLFTTPDFDVDVAKWVVRRVAFNYDICDNTEMTALNQVPRRFRRAFSQAVDDTVERELIRLCESTFIPNEGDSPADTVGDDESFLFFCYSPRLSDSGRYNGSDIESGSKSPSGDGCRIAVGADTPTISKKLNIRNMVTSTLAIFGAPTKRELNMKKKLEKKSGWRSRNAVIDHSEPYEFQRVIEIHYRERKAAVMDPLRAEKACDIVDTLLPLAEIMSQSLFSSDMARSQVTHQRSLNQFIWTNFPASFPAKEKQAGTNVVAWVCGSCIIFYPMTSVSMNLETHRRVRFAVTALFNVLEPLLKAKTKILV